jgi:hypothetical protein
MENDIKVLETKLLNNSLTALERCWAIKNYIGTATNRYDLADQIGVTICDLMISQKDDTADYWVKVKDYILGGR